MSRHEIPAKSPRHTVFVGWDEPLQTYFGQVYYDGREGPIAWFGAGYPRIQEIDLLAAAMQPFAVLSPDIRRTLWTDRNGAEVLHVNSKGGRPAGHAGQSRA